MLPFKSKARLAKRVIRKAELPCPSVTSAEVDKDQVIHATCSNNEDYVVKSNGGIYLPYRCSVSRKYHLGFCPAER